MSRERLPSFSLRRSMIGVGTATMLGGAVALGAGVKNLAYDLPATDKQISEEFRARATSPSDSEISNQQNEEELRQRISDTTGDKKALSILALAGGVVGLGYGGWITAFGYSMPRRRHKGERFTR